MEMALAVPQYTVADLDLLPDDGNRYEGLAGTLLVPPSPASAHQGVAVRLSSATPELGGELAARRESISLHTWSSRESLARSASSRRC
jgi:hypothetical protein